MMTEAEVQKHLDAFDHTGFSEVVCILQDEPYCTLAEAVERIVSNGIGGVEVEYEYPI